MDHAVYTPTKVCTKCGEEKPISQYHKQVGGKYDKKAKCKKCSLEYQAKKYRDEHPLPETIPGTKWCEQCSTLKSVDDFHKCSRNRSGLAGECKECAKSRVKQWVVKNAERSKLYQREYRKLNKEELIKYHRRHYLSNIDKYREQSRSYYYGNRDRLLQKQREYYLNNSDAIKAYQREYNTNNPDKVRDRHKQYYEKNKRWLLDNWKEKGRLWKRNNRDKVLSYVHKRRAMKMKNGGSYTVEEWNDLCNRYGNMCLCCGKSADEERLTIDHVIPIIKGGNNYIFNLQCLCLSCNLSKGVRYTDYRTTQTMHEKARLHLVESKREMSQWTR